MCREREVEKARQGLKIECRSVGPCVGERHTKMATKAETVLGGATNGGELSSALRASVNPSESWSEIS